MSTEVTSINAIPGLHSMGHTCANLNGELLFIWGGTIGDNNLNQLAIEQQQHNNRRDQAGGLVASNSNCDLWIYDTFTGYWRHRRCSGECPPHLSSCSSCLIGQKMYIFGGHSTALDDWLNCLYCLNLETFEWSNVDKVVASCEPSRPIRSDKNVCWSRANKLYVFGGYGWSRTENYMDILDRQLDFQLAPDFRWPQFGWNNQLVEFEPQANVWRWPVYSGKCPSARAAHSGCLMSDDKFYLFGGRDSRERLNDLYTLDMKTLVWTQLAVLETTEPIRRPLVGHHLLEDEAQVLGEQEAEPDEEAAAELRAREHGQIVEEIGDQADIIYPMPSSSNITNEAPSGIGHQEAWDCCQTQSDDDLDEHEHECCYPSQSQLLERLSLGSQQGNFFDNSTCPVDLEDTNAQDRPTSSHNYNIHQPQQPNQSARQSNLDPNEQSIPSAYATVQEAARNINDQQPQQPQPQQLIPTNEPSEQTTSSHTVQPVGRSFCSFTPISDDKIILYGGVSSQDQNLNDCWLFNIRLSCWTPLFLNPKHSKPRLWHTGSRTRQGEIAIIGGSSSDKIDKFCTDVLTISMEPKSLKWLALDTVARTIRLKKLQNDPYLLPNMCKLIKLRKQAIAVTSRLASPRIQ